MARKPHNVKCWQCGWRGRRVFHVCEVCEDACYHNAYAPCPKCGGKVDEVWYINEIRRLDAKMAAMTPEDWAKLIPAGAAEGASA